MLYRPGRGHGPEARQGKQDAPPTEGAQETPVPAFSAHVARRAPLRTHAASFRAQFGPVVRRSTGFTAIGRALRRGDRNAHRTRGQGLRRSEARGQIEA